MTTATNKTVAEWAAESLAAVKFFERQGIDYCCGGKRPLADVCDEKGLDAGAIEEGLLQAIATEPVAEKDWNHASMSELIDHIEGRHHTFLRRELPALAQRLEKVYRVYNERYGETFPGLPEVFAGLQNELTSHMMKEEQILFPAIKRYEEAAQAGRAMPPSPFGTIGNPIRMMEMEHEEAGGALARIRAITNDYSVPDYACVTYRALMAGFAELEQDLHLHIHLENNVLFPRVLRLEAERRG
jgi:regulator of cell morphogenesis and NO signaling